VAVRRFAYDTLAFLATSKSAGHVRGCTKFIEKNKLIQLGPSELFEVRIPSFFDVGPVLFGRVEFLLSDNPSDYVARQIVGKMPLRLSA